jgi:geranylgeranyl diphosphate synthase type I
MDRARLRRGEVSTYLALAGGADQAGEGPAVRFGRSSAILAGDVAQALADQLLASAELPAGRVLAAFGHFNRMRIEAVSGEYLDLRRARLGEVDEEGARRVAALKSGSYTVVGPLLMGCALAGGSGEVSSALERYGRPLGEAFQLRDDVLGTFGDPALTGKDADIDIREGRRTALVAKAWDLGSPEVRELLGDRLGRSDLSEGEVEEVRAALRTSGALARTIELIAGLVGQAKAALAGADLAGDAARGLAELADLVALRDA